MYALPSRYVSGAKYSAKLRLLPGHPSPDVQIALICTTPVTFCRANVGTGANAFCVCAICNSHGSVESMRSVCDVPHQKMSSSPLLPAITHGSTEVLFMTPLFTRTG